jgi:hypothetical protein
MHLTSTTHQPINHVIVSRLSEVLPSIHLDRITISIAILDFIWFCPEGWYVERNTSH